MPLARRRGDWEARETAAGNRAGKGTARGDRDEVRDSKRGDGVKEMTTADTDREYEREQERVRGVWEGE